jgi:ABC-type transport system involved in multi-copper enzyme maturation permease subunit
MIIADLIKLRSLRSTVVTLLLTLVVCVGLALLLGLSGRAGMSDRAATEREWFDPVFYSFYSVLLGQFPLVVFGVLAIGGEYSSGTIRASLLAMPRRERFYASKALATGLVAAGTALVAVPVTYLVARAGLGEYGVGLDDPDMRAGLIGAFLYLPLMSLFAFGVATMVRSSAIALGVLMPLLFLGSQGIGNAPKVGRVLQFLPDQAGAVILHIAGRPVDADFNRAFGPWTGVAILALWTALSLLGGYLVLRRRDA